MFENKEHVSRNVQVARRSLEISGGDKYVRVTLTNVAATAATVSALPQHWREMTMRQGSYVSFLLLFSKSGCFPKTDIASHWREQEQRFVTS